MKELIFILTCGGILAAQTTGNAGTALSYTVASTVTANRVVSFVAGTNTLTPHVGTGNALGISTATGTPSSVVTVLLSGQGLCEYDNTPVPGNITTLNGDKCHDSGVTTLSSVSTSSGAFGRVIAARSSICALCADTLVLFPASTGSQIQATQVLSTLSGLIFMINSGSCPSGTAEVTAMSGKMPLGTLAANGDVGTTGGADSITPAGTVTAPAFTGSSATTSAVSAGTPAGTNAVSAVTIAWPAGVPTSGSITMSGSTATESAHTHSVTGAGTNGTSSTTATGTVSAPVVSWPAGVPTNASGAFAEGALSWPAGVPTNASGAFSDGAISWPAGVPTFAGSALATHSHTAGTLADATSGSGVKLFTSSGTGVSAATLSGSTQAITAGTPAGTVAWPAGVPTIAAGVFTQPTVSWPAGVPAIAVGVFTQPTVSWPAGVPTNSTPTFTGSSSTVSAQTFTGSAVTSGAGSAHSHAIGTIAASTPTLSWPAGVPTGATTAQTFTGSALSTHTHTLVATGTNSVPAFTGTAFDNRSAWVKVIYCKVN